MGFIAPAIGAIGSALGGVFGTTAASVAAGIASVGSAAYSVYQQATTTLGSGLAGAFGNSVGLADDILRHLGDVIGVVKDHLSGILSQFGGDIESLFKSGFGDFMGHVGSILGEVNKAVDAVSKEVNGVITPIAHTVNALTQTVQNIDDKLILPVTRLVTTTEQEVNTVLSSIHQDLHQGIQGIMKLPTDIANALTTVDAQFARATQELAHGNKDIVDNALVPGLVGGIGKPLDLMSQALALPEFTQDEQAVFERVDSLDESALPEQALKLAKEWEATVSNRKGFIGELVKGLWHILKNAEFLAASFVPITEEIKQLAYATNPPALLAPADVIEALRRGLLIPDDAKAELLKHGINSDRQKVLYDLAQFLFDPRQALDLWFRGIVSGDQLKALMDQNNLSGEQADALRQLMLETLGPANTAAAEARGYIESRVAEEQFQADRVPQELRDVVRSLELALVPPNRMMALRGRQEALDAGWLGGELGPGVPEDIAQQYRRAQTEDGTAALDWLGHWDIPAARWWVTAYFRGIRTRTEVEQAFKARNIPEALWNDIFVTEEELPPVWLVPDIVAAGVWSEDKAVPQLMKLGFSEENAKVLYEYGYSKSKSGKATTAANLQKVSLGNARKMFDDGLVTQPQYEQILLDHGYSAEAAQLTASLANFEEQQTQRKNAADLLVEEVKLGALSKDQAESQLYNMGFATGEVAKYLDKIEAARVLNRKLPSETQVKDAFKKGLIDGQAAVAQLELLGYDLQWASIIFQTW